MIEGQPRDPPSDTVTELLPSLLQSQPDLISSKEHSLQLTTWPAEKLLFHKHHGVNISKPKSLSIIWPRGPLSPSRACQIWCSVATHAGAKGESRIFNGSLVSDNCFPWYDMAISVSTHSPYKFHLPTTRKFRNKQAPVYIQGKKKVECNGNHQSRYPNLHCTHTHSVDNHPPTLSSNTQKTRKPSQV